ncbi:beta-lactamase/transpeptidase-like protein, partial [Obba rivulosa]
STQQSCQVEKSRVYTLGPTEPYRRWSAYKWPLLPYAQHLSLSSPLAGRWTPISSQMVKTSGAAIVLSLVGLVGISLLYLSGWDSGRPQAIWKIALSLSKASFTAGDVETDSGNRTSNWAITPEIRDFVEDMRDKLNIRGISIGVVLFDDANGAGPPEMEFGSWGIMTEDQEEVTPDTLFPIGPCSKAFLSTSLGLLMDDFASGRNQTKLPPDLAYLTWDTKISSLLPDTEWRLQDASATEKVSLRDALTHMSGLAVYDFSMDPSEDALDVVQRMRFLKPAHELREKWSYNNLAIFLRHPYATFVTERILQPLNMSATTYDVAHAQRSGKLSHAWSRQGRRIPLQHTLRSGNASEGPEGLISNVVDMTKWLATVMNLGRDPWRDRRDASAYIFPRHVIMETTTAHAVMQGRVFLAGISTMGYGMGWRCSSYRDREMVLYESSATGFSSYMAFLNTDRRSIVPSKRLGIVAFANYEELSGLRDVAHDIINHVLELPPLDDFIPDTFTQNSGILVGLEDIATAGSHMSLEAYEGTYHNPGYGTFTLCAPTNVSAHCRDILTSFASVPNYQHANVDHTPNDIPTNPDSFSINSPKPAWTLQPGLYGYWPRSFSTHIGLFPLTQNTSHMPFWGNNSLSPIPPNAFAVDLPALFSHGFGRNSTPYAYHARGMLVAWFGPRVEFVVLDGAVTGFGFFTKMGDELMNLDRGFNKPAGRNRTVEARADAWFVRL